MVLRSKSPTLILQEISFVAALRIARRSISVARDFPPQTTSAH